MTARRLVLPTRVLRDLAVAHRIAEAAGEPLAVCRAFLPLFRRHLGISFARLVLRDDYRRAIGVFGGRLGQPVAGRRYTEDEAPGLALIIRGSRRARWSEQEIPGDIRRRGERGIALPVRGLAPNRAMILFLDRDALHAAEPLADAFVAHLAAALANADSYRRSLDLSFRDELTGVYNYRFLMEALDREAKRAQRFSHLFSIVMLDLDNLKGYNDRFGHLRGSEAIRTLGEILNADLRRVDLPARYGGDEFVILLPRTDKKGALKVCERLRQKIRSTVYASGGLGAITASFGVATFPEDGKTPRVLLRRADRALYRAKGQGRDTVST